MHAHSTGGHTAAHHTAKEGKDIFLLGVINGISFPEAGENFCVIVVLHAGYHIHTAAVTLGFRIERRIDERTGACLVQGFYGNDQGVFGTLDFHVHIGSHAGQHAGGLVQENFRGILGHAGGGVGSFADIAYQAGIYLFPYGTDGNLCLLVFFQRQNIRFVHADGDGHGDVGIQGHYAGGTGSCDVGGGAGAVVKFHGTDDTVHGSQQGTVPVKGQQLQQNFLQIGPVTQQRVIIGAETGVFQTEQRTSVADGSIFLCCYTADGAGIAGDTQGIVNRKGCLADDGAVGCGYGDFFTVLRAVVRDQNGSGTAGSGRYFPFQNRAVFPGYGNPITFAEVLRFQVGGHMTVDTQHGQSAVFCHAQGNIHAFFCVDDLYSAGNACGYLGAGFVAFGGMDIFVQIIHLILQGGQ